MHFLKRNRSINNHGMYKTTDLKVIKQAALHWKKEQSKDIC